MKSAHMWIFFKMTELFGGGGDFCDIYVKFGIQEPRRHVRFLTHLPPILVGVISQ